MSDYILRQDAFDVMCEILCDGHENCDENTCCCSAKLMKSIPAADVQPVVRGVWVKNGWSIRCSICGYDMPFATRNFCPNCGARMDGD